MLKKFPVPDVNVAPQFKIMSGDFHNFIGVPARLVCFARTNLSGLQTDLSEANYLR